MSKCDRLILFIEQMSFSGHLKTYAFLFAVFNLVVGTLHPRDFNNAPTDSPDDEVDKCIATFGNGAGYYIDCKKSRLKRF